MGPLMSLLCMFGTVGFLLWIGQAQTAAYAALGFGVLAVADVLVGRIVEAIHAQTRELTRHLSDQTAEIRRVSTP